MSRINKTIQITLQSDLCVGSGYAFAGIIDTDVCYDECGFPYIPARRMKGCMREAAQTLLGSLIDHEKLIQLFGETGQEAAKGIHIRDARLKGYPKMAEEAKLLLAKGDIQPQDLLGEFTRVLGQTALEDGVAKENSLRYTRVVNQFFPGTEEALCFFADIELEDDWEKDLELVLKATRHLGLKRNRGLGLVKMELVDKAESCSQAVWQFSKEDFGDEEDVLLSFVLENTAPLVLSAASDQSSERYISGQSVLGYLAGCWLREDGHQADSFEFRQLFLDGTSRFTNLYPFEGEIPQDGLSSMDLFYPAPEYVSKTKKTKQFMNQFLLQTGAATVESGDQPKRLKGQFVRIRDNQPETLEAAMKNEYHHTGRLLSRDGKNTDPYVLEVLEAGQQWAGRIYTKGQYVKCLTEHLQAPSFGKSKTAQYGGCRLIWGKVETPDAKRLNLEKGDRFMMTLLSDGLFLGETGYTVYGDEVEQILQEALGGGFATISPEGEEKTPCPIIQTKVSYGYNSKWNLRREPLPALAAGSCFVFQANQALSLPAEVFLGEKNQEGFGQVRVEKLIMQPYTTAEAGRKIKEGGEGEQPVRIEILKGVYKEIRAKKEMLEFGESAQLNISASALGRITLMLKESMEAHPRNAEKVFEEFGKRVGSIKSDQVRGEMERAIKTIDAQDSLWPEKWMYRLEMLKYANKDKKNGGKEA